VKEVFKNMKMLLLSVAPRTATVLMMMMMMKTPPRNQYEERTDRSGVHGAPALRTAALVNRIQAASG